MSANGDQFKNNPEEVKNMALLPTESVASTKLSSMDHTKRLIQWNHISSDLDDTTFKWYCTNAQITSERLCQLPVVIAKLKGKYKNATGVEKTVHCALGRSKFNISNTGKVTIGNCSIIINLSEI